MSPGSLLAYQKDNGYKVFKLDGNNGRVTTEYKDAASQIVGTSWTQTRGLVTTNQDIEGNQSSSVADIRGNTTSATSLTGTVNYAYNARNQVTAIDGVGSGDTITTSYGSNWNTQPLTLTDPDLGVVTYAYHYSGQLKTQTDGNDNTLAVDYNTAGQPTSLHKDTTSGAVVSSWNYDDTGRATQSTNNNTSTTGSSAGVVTKSYGYDSRGRLDTTTWTIPGLSGTPTISQVYRETGGVESITYPNATTTSFGHDGLERQDTLTYAGESLGHAPAFNARGQLTSYKAGTSGQTGSAYATTTLNYVAWSGRLERKQVYSGTTNLADFTYDWDLAGNLDTLHDQTGSVDQWQCFDYDTTYRLKEGYTTSGTCSTGTQNTGPDPYDVTYTYFANGNINKALGTGTVNSTYGYGSGNAGPHAVHWAGSGNSFGYSTGGLMTSRTVSGQTQALTYDIQNRLVGIDGPGTAGDLDALYDAGGNRVKRTIDGTTTYYLGENYQIKLDGASTEVQVHQSFNGVSVGTTVDGDFVLNVTDHLGSSGTQREEDGTTTTQSYTPFGAVRGGGGNSLLTDQTFTGQTDDPSTGLIDYNARHYDPVLGRFIMADTVLDGLNRYTYVRNNPLNAIDPTGNCKLANGAVVDGYGTQKCEQGGHSYDVPYSDQRDQKRAQGEFKSPVSRESTPAYLFDSADQFTGRVPGLWCGNASKGRCAADWGKGIVVGAAAVTAAGIVCTTGVGCVLAVGAGTGAGVNVFVEGVVTCVDAECSDNSLSQVPGDALEGAVMGSSASYFGYLNAQALGPAATKPAVGNLTVFLQHPEMIAAVYTTALAQRVAVKAVVPAFRMIAGSYL